MADGDQGAETLSKRELEVATAYASGESYKEIARTLGLSPTTVRTHLRTVYTKLSVTSKIELARFLEGDAAPDPSLDQSEVAADLALELDDSVRRERSLSRILKIISDQNEDLDTVIDAVLDHALEICEAEFGILFEYQGDMTFRELRSRNISPEFAEWLTEQQTFKVEPGTGIGRVASDLQPVNIADVRGEDIYQSGAPLRIATADFGKARSFAAIPMMSGGRLIGAFTVYRTRVHPFNDRALELASVFADQAVIAIENVRQFREVQTRLEREAVNRELLELISLNRDDEQPIFDVIVQRARALCNADIAGLILGQEGGPPQRVAAHSGTSEQMLKAYQDGHYPMDPKLSAGAKCIIERRVVLLEDAPNDELYRRGSTERQTAVLREGIRSNLHVPLIADGRGIGCLVLARRSLRPYLPEEISLVEAFAAQAVIAIENVRQFREVQTRLEREAVNREILHLISQHRDDERPVFDFILESACRLCRARSAFVITLDETGEFVHSPAQFGASPEFAAVFENWSVPYATSPLGAVVSMRERRVVAVDDIADSDLYKSGNQDRLNMVDIEGIRSIVNVPLLSGDKAVGALLLYRTEVRPFSDEDIALVEAFAAQAVIAVENVRQFRNLQNRLEREAVNREILQVISHSRNDEKPVFNAILENACRLCEAQSAFVIVRDESGEFVYSPAQVGASEEFASVFKDWRAPYATSPLGAVVSMRERRVVTFDDLADTDLYRSGNPDRVRQVELEGVRSLVNVPLLTAGEAIGSMILYRREVRPFSDEHIALVEAFAAQAVIAIENVRQFKALEARTEEVQALNASLEERVEDQVGEIERMGKLKRFLPAAVADTVVSQGAEATLKSHRALLGVLFCDIRGFTAFCETAEPEETIEVLQTYHQEMGKLINAHGAGVDHRMGDGIMVLFNDPLPCDDPAGDAVRLAIAMRARMEDLSKQWKRLGFRLGFGVGVSLGYATVGMVGFEGRFDYTASGTAVNLASRLCDEAEDGEILLSPRAGIAVEDDFKIKSRGEATFKGIREPIEIFSLQG